MAYVKMPLKYEASKNEPLTLTFKDNRLAREVYGAFDEHLRYIEKRLGVVLVSRGNELTITGAPLVCEEARHLLERLYKQAKLGLPLSAHEIEAALRFSHEAYEPLEAKQMQPPPPAK